MRQPRRWWAGLAALVVTACGGDDASAPTAADTEPTSTPATASPSTVVRGGRCLVRLHGKGGSGADTYTEGDVTVLAPTGNADGWDGRQWLYFPEAQYAAARDIVTDAVEPCERIIVNGFSNGAAFAAKLFCRGEAFDGRLVGVVVDDPVVDHAVEDCTPAPGVAVTLYWTGALESTAQPGWDCAQGDWTCEGGTTIGIEAYADAVGAEVVDSPFDDHQWYTDAPELSQW